MSDDYHIRHEKIVAVEDGDVICEGIETVAQGRLPRVGDTLEMEFNQYEVYEVRHYPHNSREPLVLARPTTPLW
jgi:hypothetical protein